jgi:Glutaminase
MQSVSKLFGMALVLAEIGDRVWQGVGREPSGSPFNSLAQLESERGIPRNPFINAGAPVVPTGCRRPQATPLGRCASSCGLSPGTRSWTPTGGRPVRGRAGPP